MPVSRKYKSLKKSSKTKNHSKNVKKYKSKTRKNINKLRGGNIPLKTECDKSTDCFDEYAAQFIKESMREYLKKNKTNIKQGSPEENEIKKNLYHPLYLQKGLFHFEKTGSRKYIYEKNNESLIKSEIKDILDEYFAKLKQKEEAEKKNRFSQFYR
jgi:hypothetical protein